MKRLFLVIIILIIIFVIFLYSFSNFQEKTIEINSKISIKDVTYSNSSGSKFDENMNSLIEIDKDYQNYTTKITGQNWSTIIYKQYDNDKTKLAAILLLMSQEAYLSVETTYATGGMNIKDEEWLSLNINKIDNKTSKGNILKLIDNLKIIENFYLEKNLSFAKTGINRLNFLYGYIDNSEFPKDDFTVFFNDAGFNENISFEDAVNNTLLSYGIIYKTIMTKIDVTEVNNKTITIKNTGLADLDIKDYTFYIYEDYESTNYTCSKYFLSPGSTTSCVLDNSCFGKEVIINYFGGSKKFNCSG
jgi:hypothetical protein